LAENCFSSVAQFLLLWPAFRSINGRVYILQMLGLVRGGWDRINK
jgi:hypothetical protein